MMLKSPFSTLFPYTTLFRSPPFESGTNRKGGRRRGPRDRRRADPGREGAEARHARNGFADDELRSEEHTSELQSRRDLVCRLLLEKKKNKKRIVIISAGPSV